MGMRTLATAAVSLSALVAASGAQAQSAVSTSSFTVVGSAPKVCTISEPTLSSVNEVNIDSLDGSTLKISQLTSTTTLSTLPASARVSFNAVCTFAHTVTIQSQNNGLWRDGSSQPMQNGFADAVPWTGRIQWANIDRTFVAGAQNRQIVNFPFPIATPNAGQLLFDISIQAGSTNSVANGPLLAGSYQDTIYITLEPQ
ncbi:MAG TPA: hypothetical protein VGL66_00565 [Caulobacteraceae bacterium]|jgi:hypothetical protein